MSQKQSLRDSLYLSEDPSETTFKYDNQLPSLPVPSVQESIFKLLDTIKPIVSDENDFKETERKALEVLQDPEVNELQELLINKSKKEKNWLESWWLEFAYLRSRKPLIPYSNMSAPLPILSYWPIVREGDTGYTNARIKRAALSTFFQLSFWQMLRQERMRPMIHKGVPWSMNQFRYLFNTVRIPNEPKDELSSCFRTAVEGEPVSTEIIVLHKGHIFAINAITITNGQVAILAAPQIEKQFRYIEKLCESRPPGPGVGALTTHERTEWTESRKKLASVSPKNQQILDRIERALSVFILDDNEPTSNNEIFLSSMCGNPKDRWADKSISSIAFKNGTFGASADHTPYDGFCTAVMTHYLMTSLEECLGVWNDSLGEQTNSSKAIYKDPEPLEFTLNVQLEHLIEEAISHFHTVCSTIDTLHETFNHYGKAILKEHRFHPEAFVQCAIHAAYFKMYRRMAPAYVTASTRRFHNGRTETCRSCYPEMKDFASFLASEGSSKPKQGYDMLKRSVEKFQKVMDEASQGRGCDRHLMGLYLLAMFEGKKIPELFDDELVRRTNNYILSTSCGGYWNVCGGVPPLVEEGYGCFYGIEDNAITFCCTAYKTCKDTDLRTFYKYLNDSLVEMQKLMVNAKL